MPKFQDLTGQTFNSLYVLYRVHNSSSNKVQYLCRCACGKELVVCGAHLKNGNTKTCGCGKRERIIKASTIHGKSHSRIYKIWSGIKRRCKSEHCRNYKNYGGRGISVCAEWDNSFESFYQWAISHGYQSNYSIDRIDVDGNYDPSNCRWASNKEQANNKRNNLRITINGETKTMTQWANKYGIRVGTLWSRIKAGLTGDKLLNGSKDNQGGTQ